MKRCFIALLALFAISCQTPQWPVEGRLSSPYGMRMEGVRGDLHRGVDIAAPHGTPVRPVLSGRVRFAGTMSGYGQVIWIDHPDDVITVYAHLSEISVQAGQEVSKGTVIGLTGQSGNARGPHLHLEIWRWGREVDPVAMLGRPTGS
ncbi:MAG: M23 family metallopeptidase [Gemmatimonadota bacterium]|nr:M23 family metallopeptidase [Gemmatimonadota bacterium]